MRRQKMPLAMTFLEIAVRSVFSERSGLLFLEVPWICRSTSMAYLTQKRKDECE